MKTAILVGAALLLAVAGAPAIAQQQPDRSNKAGEVRGKDRAAQVKEQNDQKRAASKDKKEAKPAKKAN